MKIVVIGTGYVASAYLRVAHFLGYHPLVLSRSWFNYEEYGQLRFCLGEYEPDLVINAAGFTGRYVDDCESNRRACFAANVKLPITITDVCSAIKCKLIHISSGCIFDGPGQYTEEDTPNFTSNFYQGCKVTAERFIKEDGDVYIFRIRMPFNHEPSPRNWLMKLCLHDKILDGLNSVTFLDQFAMRSFQLVQISPPGIYHCAESTPVRTAEVAQMLVDAGLRHRPVELWDPAEFSKCYIPRSNAVLDCSKFEQAYRSPFGDAMSGIRWCIDRLANPGADCSGKGSIYVGYHKHHVMLPKEALV